MKKHTLSYKAINYNFYFKNELLMVFKDINYLLLSIGTIKSSNGDLLLKYRKTFSLNNRVKIIFQNFEYKIELKKEKNHLSLFLYNQDKIQKINMVSPFKIMGNFEANIFVDNVLFGEIFQKFEEKESVYYFYFLEEDHPLNYYCLILFAIKYYYYTDEIA